VRSGCLFSHGVTTDGFAFANSWTLDATERAALKALAQRLVPAAVAAVALAFPEAILWSTLFPGIMAAATAYTAFGPNQLYGLCGGMAYQYG
jgi:hypothetical protein